MVGKLLGDVRVIRIHGRHVDQPRAWIAAHGNGEQRPAKVLGKLVDDGGQRHDRLEHRKVGARQLVFESRLGDVTELEQSANERCAVGQVPEQSRLDRSLPYGARRKEATPEFDRHIATLASLSSRELKHDLGSSDQAELVTRDTLHGYGILPKVLNAPAQMLDLLAKLGVFRIDLRKLPRERTQPRDPLRREHHHGHAHGGHRQDGDGQDTLDEKDEAVHRGPPYSGGPKRPRNHPGCNFSLQLQRPTPTGPLVFVHRSFASIVALLSRF